MFYMCTYCVFTLHSRATFAMKINESEGIMTEVTRLTTVHVISSLCPYIFSRHTEKTYLII